MSLANALIINMPDSALEVAEHARLTISPKLETELRARLGQFMTPAPIASFMASLFDALPEHVTLLDAGAGAGVLTAAFVGEVCARTHKPASIQVTAFEVDPVMVVALIQTLLHCKVQCEAAGIVFESRIIEDDFILRASEPLLNCDFPSDGFNCAILNPPYAKIRNNSPARKALRRIGIETTNLYSAFVGLALQRLGSQAQLVAITPRSFCNGAYFLNFREFLIDQTSIERVHVYESRKRAFSDDEVLQENVILKLRKSRNQANSVLVSSSHDASGADISVQVVPFEQVVIPTDPYRYVRLPLTDDDASLAARVGQLPCSLADLGVSVSTGRVVDFRSKEFLRPEPSSETAPLIYPTHFSNGFVSWPRPNSKKPNAIVFNDATRSLFVPNGFYLLTKRFTSKEEKRRVVAAVFTPDTCSSEFIGFENHLNFFHCKGAGLAEILCKGFAVFINSTAVDQFFRQFSGHTQVNATDLRNLHYPELAELERIGNLIGDELPTQEEIDEIVDNLLCGNFK